MRSINKRTFTYLAFSLTLLALLSGQTQQTPTTPQKAPAPSTDAKGSPVTFSTTTQLVLVDVTVKDKNGNLIEGLTEKDFAVTEDNVPQSISFCKFEKLDDVEPPGLLRRDDPKAAEPKAEVPAEKKDDKKVDSVTAVQIMPEAPGDVRYQNKRMLTFYFDMSAMPEADQYRAQGDAIKFIHTKMQPNDMISIMEFTDGVKVLTDFTSDKEKLETVLNKMVIGDDLGMDETTSDDSTADTGTAFGEDDSEFNLFNTDRQLAALQTAVKYLAGLNEKKVLIYFSSGLQLNGTDNQAQFLSTVNMAAKANVTFFTIDSRGLTATPPMGDAMHGSSGGAGMYNGRSALAMVTTFNKSQDNIYALATDTGGKALLDNNDLTIGIQNAEKFLTSYYIIGYYSKNEALDGKYRKIKVTFNGDASAKLEYRQGYWANKTFNKFTTADKERQLQDALMLGDPITELNIVMEADYFQLNSAEYYTPVTFKIPGSELALARRGGHDRTSIEFIGEVKDEYNTTIANVRDTVSQTLSGETAAQLAHHPIQYNTAFTLLPGTYSIKVLARDDETGRIGTYMSKIVIPNLNKVLDRLPISSVVISGQRIQQSDTFATVKDKKSGPTVSPLMEGGMQLIPSVTNVFSKSRDMYVYLQAYERGATDTQPLVAYVTFYRGQQKAFETPQMLITQGLDTKSKAVPLKFLLALNKLQPGRYNCQVTVLDPTNSKAAFWQAPVALVP
ncbi:MAG TPA: VWA domain-containing protein [Verrucomicrobiae bacterium]|nr:VWA domain-containing protein [Verrucomicrobiae bacterium]